MDIEICNHDSFLPDDRCETSGNGKRLTIRPKVSGPSQPRWFRDT